MSFFVNDDRDQAILQGVIAEDIGNRGADDGAEPEPGQRPGCVLTARSAAKVVSRQRIWQPEEAGWLRTKPGLGEPSAL